MAILKQTQRNKQVLTDRPRQFYVGAAVVLVGLMFLGFQQFYLHGRAYPGQALPPPLRTLLIVHGLGMTAWVVLFLVQTVLIATARRQLHRTLGYLGAALAAGLVPLGWHLGIAAARISPPGQQIAGMSPRQFLAVPIFNIAAFALFAGIGVWQRRQAAAHRPMLLLASVAALSAAISRIDAISALYHGTPWETWFGPFFGMLLVGGVFLAAKVWLTRVWDWWYAIGYAGLVFYCALAIWLAKTHLWNSWAGYLLGQ